MNTIISVPQERIVSQIYVIRGKKVMIDRDLAALYEVETKVLNQAVRRNNSRFPLDFMFQLSAQEFNNLKSQFVTSSWGGIRKLPYVFTEQGVAMLSSVLNSRKAIQVNIQIIRTFTKLREILSTNKQLAEKIELLEKKYDRKITQIFELLNKLTTEEKTQKDRIGFRTK